MGQLQPPIPAGSFWQYHFLNLSVPDLVIVGLMVVGLVAAIAIRFPGGRDK